MLPLLTYGSHPATLLVAVSTLVRCGGQGSFCSDSLNLRLWWGKLARLLLILKSSGLMSPIAEGLVCGVSAAAESDCGASGQAVGLTLHVDKFDFAFDAQWSITAYDNFR
jgi:hypothetical protein